MIEADLVAAISEGEGFDHGEAQCLVIKFLLVMIAQHDVLLAGELGADLKELQIALSAAEEEVAQMENGVVRLYHLMPTLLHQALMVLGAIRIFDDVLMKEVGIADYVERNLKTHHLLGGRIAHLS